MAPSTCLTIGCKCQVKHQRQITDCNGAHSRVKLKLTRQFAQQRQSLQLITFGISWAPALLEGTTVIQNKNKTLFVSLFVLNKLIASHSSPGGDKLRAEVHNRKAQNCPGERMYKTEDQKHGDMKLQHTHA